MAGSGIRRGFRWVPFIRLMKSPHLFHFGYLMILVFQGATQSRRFLDVDLSSCLASSVDFDVRRSGSVRGCLPCHWGFAICPHGELRMPSATAFLLFPCRRCSRVDIASFVESSASIGMLCSITKQAEVSRRSGWFDGQD